MDITNKIDLFLGEGYFATRGVRMSDTEVDTEAYKKKFGKRPTGEGRWVFDVYMKDTKKVTKTETSTTVTSFADARDQVLQKNKGAVKISLNVEKSTALKMDKHSKKYSKR